MLEKLGFEPEQNNTKFLIPGISPGKNTPIVTDFMQQDNDYKKFDTFGTLTNDKTMTEKIESLQDTVQYFMCVQSAGLVVVLPPTRL